MRWPVLICLLFATVAAARERSVAGVASLVDDRGSIDEALQQSLGSTDALVRTTATRVAIVRNVASLVPLIRELLARETDATAAREEIRALALLGDENDVDTAIAASSKWPMSVDVSLANAIARRGGLDAIRIYINKLGTLRDIDRRDFFRQALWGRAALAPAAGAMLLGHNDDAGWNALLDTLTHASIAMAGGVLAAGFTSGSEAIRSDSVWYVALGYAADPARIAPEVRTALAAPPETESDREAFGRELLRRMLGAKMEERARWNEWLKSKEADAYLGNAEAPIFTYLTDGEFRIRKAQCSMLPTQCTMPETKGWKVIPSTPVAPPEFFAPSTLPAGIVTSLMPRNCASPWIGLANVSVDPAGRVTAVSLTRMAELPPCVSRMLSTILRLSLVTNNSIVSAMKSDQVLLVGRSDIPPCLDEAPPNNAPSYALRRLPSRFTEMQAIRKIEPNFPSAVIPKMGRQHSVDITLEAVISQTGCVRNVRVISQTPFPELNSAALQAFVRWTFKPATLDGVPADVIYELLVRFQTP